MLSSKGAPPMKHSWIVVATLLCLGCQEQLPTQTDTVYDPITGDTRQEIVSITRFAGVTIMFNHTRQLIELDNGNDVAVRVRIEREDNTILADKWIIFAGWDASKSVRFNRGDTVTITVWHLNLLLTDPIREFSETVRL